MDQRLIDLPKLWTSRWANGELARLPFVPVGISRGVPRWPLPFRYRVARLLAPSRATFALEDDADFEREYLRELEEAGVEKIGDLLRRLSDEGGGRPLVLLCWERDRADCHRRMFAEWWFEQTGQRVEELESCGASHKRRPGTGGGRQDAQDRLF